MTTSCFEWKSAVLQRACLWLTLKRSWIVPVGCHMFRSPHRNKKKRRWDKKLIALRCTVTGRKTVVELLLAPFVWFQRPDRPGKVQWQAHTITQPSYHSSTDALLWRRGCDKRQKFPAPSCYCVRACVRAHSHTQGTYSSSLSRITRKHTTVATTSKTLFSLFPQRQFSLFTHSPPSLFTPLLLFPVFLAFFPFHLHDQLNWTGTNNIKALRMKRVRRRVAGVRVS